MVLVLLNSSRFLEKVSAALSISTVLRRLAGPGKPLDDLDPRAAKTYVNNVSGLKFFCRLLFSENGISSFIPSAGQFHFGPCRKRPGQIFEEMQKAGDYCSPPWGGYQLPEWIRISIGTPAQK